MRFTNQRVNQVNYAMFVVLLLVAAALGVAVFAKNYKKPTRLSDRPPFNELSIQPTFSRYS